MYFVVDHQAGFTGSNVSYTFTITIWVVLRKGVPRGVTVFESITHLLSIKKINIGDFHVSVAINI